jgi:hypothetical protein
MNILSQMSEELGVSGANQEGAEVPLPFKSLGEAADAVILRLSARLPRIKVKVASPRTLGRGKDGDSR